MGTRRAAGASNMAENGKADYLCARGCAAVGEYGILAAESV